MSRSSGIGGAPPEQEDPRADRIWGTVPRLVEDAALRHGALEALVDGELRLTYAQLAQEVDRYARGFVAAVLGDGHPCCDVAVLLASELFGNSVRHSASGLPGQTVTVAVSAAGGVIRVGVTDRSGPGTPQPRPVGPDAEGGRGLRLVEELSARWGWRRRGGRTVTWFELRNC